MKISTQLSFCRVDKENNERCDEEIENFLTGENSVILYIDKCIGNVSTKVSGLKSRFYESNITHENFCWFDRRKNILREGEFFKIMKEVTCIVHCVDNKHKRKHP